MKDVKARRDRMICIISGCEFFGFMLTFDIARRGPQVMWIGGTITTEHQSVDGEIPKGCQRISSS